MTAKEAIEKLQTFEDQSEAVFVLRGRDPLAGYAVLEWAIQARYHGVNADKIKEAGDAAVALKMWKPKKLPD
jgi:hypothetical protein